MGSARGHIGRLQKRLIKSGYLGVPDEEFLELILSLRMPEKDFAKQSKEAIKRFKTFRGVLLARPEDLQQIEGFGTDEVLAISAAREIARKLMRERIVERPIYQTGQEIFDLFYFDIRDLKEEVFKVIYLDSRKQIIGTQDVFKSLTDSSTAVYPREVIENAINKVAKYLVFIHNHPSGDPNPTRSDREITRDLVYAGMIMQIRVLDHIIIGENRFFSFAGEGLIDNYEKNFLRLKIRRNTRVS